MTGAEPVLSLHPDRLLPADPGTRDVARRIYQQTRDLPLLCPHGHVEPRQLLDDVPFADPAALLVTPDHYVTRLLHASGVGLADLGVGQGPLSEPQSRSVWRLLCAHWNVFAGTPVRYWLEAELADIFEVSTTPSEATADAIYDHIAERLARPQWRPRALFDRFGIEVLATTDDPCDDLVAHAALDADPTWHGRVIPTFRPDRYLEPGEPGWSDRVGRLAQAADIDTGSYPGYLRALEARRRFFISRGATSADHSHVDAGTEPLAAADADRIYRAALAGTASQAETVAFRRHMQSEMARMSCEDGLVMTLHPGVRRNHHGPTFDRFGADVGADIPVRIELTDALRPLLDRYGTAAGFHLVVFTVDETVWSRELAPMAGFYPCLYVGAPWWFLDAPETMRRFRLAVAQIAGFTRTAGFVDDTRAFCSVPARHDLARRIDAGVLAGLVAEHQLDEAEATRIAVDLVGAQPRAVFKL
jgi:glucuronate isomerase